MHLLWLAPEVTPESLTQLRRMREQGHVLTLGYQPSQKMTHDILREFDAAFPWIAPQLQLPQIAPDKILTTEWPDELPTSPPRPRSLKKKRSLSVIMRSRNDAQVIGQTLKSLFSQTVDVTDVLLIDSSSTDSTRQIASEYPIQVLTIPAEDYYPGRVLNRAMSMTKGEWVVFLNSDAVLLTPLSLENLLSRLDDPTVAAAYARQLPRPDAAIWVRRDYESAFPDADMSPPWMSLSLCLAAMKRHAWEQHAFYTDAWGSEDIEWGRWAKSSGWNIDYAFNALCMHSHNYSLRQLYGRRYIEGEADAFIIPRKYSWGRLLRDVLVSSAKDVAAYWKARNYYGLLGIPIRRWVYHWAYFRGNRWGNKRKRTGNSDTKSGQQTVLKRYD